MPTHLCPFGPQTNDDLAGSVKTPLQLIWLNYPSDSVDSNSYQKAEACTFTNLSVTNVTHGSIHPYSYSRTCFSESQFPSNLYLPSGFTVDTATSSKEASDLIVSMFLGNCNCDRPKPFGLDPVS